MVHKKQYYRAINWMLIAAQIIWSWETMMRNIYRFLFIDISDAPIMIFLGRFRYRFFSSKLADSDSDTDFFSL